MSNGASGRFRRAAPWALGLVALLCLWIPGGRPAHVAHPSAESAQDPHRAEPAPAAPVETVSMSGRLVGPDGEGLADAHVAAWREEDPAVRIEGQTDRDGLFVLEGLPPDPSARWVVSATASGYGEARVVRGLSGGDVALTAERVARVAGQVLGLDGAPAPAEVLIVGSAIWPARSTYAGPDGRFAFEDVPPGVYEVEARGALASSEPRRGLVVEEGGRVVLTLALTPGRTLDGTVVDDATGAPIANAEIVVAESALSSTPRTTHTDATGAFHLTGLRDGVDAIVSVHAEGLVPIVAQAWSGGPLALRLSRAGAVAGVVLDADRRPIEGARLEVWGEQEGGQPIALSEGTAALAAFAGMPSAPADPSRLEVTADVPPLPLDAVYGASTTAPVAATVTAAPQRYETDAHGVFHIDGIAPGRVQILARAAGHATTESATVRVRSGETTDGLEIQLAPAGRAIAVVQDEHGDPAADVRVEAWTERDPWPTVRYTDAHGEVSIEATGSVVLRALPLDRAPSETRLTVASASEARTTLTLDPAGLTLRGRVLDPDGYPVEGAQLRIEALRPGAPILRTTFSSDDGTFEASAVPAPPLRITIDHGSYAIGTTVDLTSLDGVEVRLAPSIQASGVLTDAWTGEPVHGARVRLVSHAVPPVVRESASREDGGYAIPRLRAGSYDVHVDAPGYVAHDAVITVRGERDGTAELPAITLDPGQRVEGDVVDHLGSVVLGATVTIQGVPPARTDEHGHFVLSAVPAGEHVLRVSQESAGTLELTRNVVRGRDDVSIIAHLPGRLDAVPTETGAPIAGRSVAVRLEGTRIAEVVRGSSAERAGLRAGDVIVSVDGVAGATLAGAAPACLLEVERRGERFAVRVDRERSAPR